MKEYVKACLLYFRHLCLSSETFLALDWKLLNNKSTSESPVVVVDVGGGLGYTTLLLAKAYSRLKFVVQDKSPVICEAEVVSFSPDLFLYSKFSGSGRCGEVIFPKH